MGIATLDLVNRVAVYPSEDDEVRALDQRRVRGGNVTNTLSILAQFGRRCRWVGTLGADAAAAMILDDLRRRGIETADVRSIPGGATPTSYITLSQATASRTIVHYRDLPELSADDFARVALDDIAWVHFEGRNPAETARMIARVRAEAPDIRVSVELEKRREGIEQLLEGPDIVLVSRAFALSSGFSDAASYLRDLVARTKAELCVVAWGAEGASYCLRDGVIESLPAQAPERVVDTLGAGDVFNAGVIHGLLDGRPAYDSVATGIRLAGIKCGRLGLDLDGVVP